MATSARNKRLEPAYKQHTAVDDERGVVVDIQVTIGQINEVDWLEPQVEAIAATTGVKVTTVTADMGYAYAKVYGAMERRNIYAVIPPKKEPIRSALPLRRFKFDARHNIVKCPTGKILWPGR